MIVCSRNGKFVKFTSAGIVWVDSEEDASVFASFGAFTNCLAMGSLRHNRLKFSHWVKK